MPPFPRQELESMVQKWLDANQLAEKDGDWAKHLGSFYTNDATYSWSMGPNQEFVAQGRDEIQNVALGYHMRGFEQWRYPYHDIVIDDQRGTIIGFYKQVATYKRSNGTNGIYQVDGVSGSWFEYAGNYQWKWQKDFFDMGNVMAVMVEMAGAGLLNSEVKKKIHTKARGVLLPGTRKIRSDPSFCTKAQNWFAMIRIALIGR